MLQYTTANGKTYQLKMKDGDFFYRWYGDGQLHPLLKGGYTDINLGKQAMERYLTEVDSKKPIKKEATLADVLEPLTKKDDLLAFANKNGFEIPDHIKIPAQIKKYLTAKVGE